MNDARKQTLRWAGFLAPAAILLALVTATWQPALFEGQTLIHGDAVSVGAVSAKVHADVMSGARPLAWSADIYGGHPYFAESIGGFSNPVNIFFAAFVSPSFGYIASVNGQHWIYMILASLGFVGLTRFLGLSPAAQIAAGIAAIFSSLWVQTQPNSTFAAVLATLPWALWAFEAWLRRPALLHAMLFGAACAWMLLSGYPQIAYGAVLYMGASLLPGFFQPSVRQDWLRTWRTRVLTGAIAIAFCLGVTAVQVLPLFELAGLSFRQGGAELVMPPSGASQILGALFWPSWTLDSLQFPLVGSILVCVLASLAPILDRQTRLLGHFAATCLLITLGLGPPFPLFNLIYDHNLLPGLHSFRIMHPFHLVGVLGVGLLAGFSADALSRAPGGLSALRGALAKPTFWLSIVLIGGWIALALTHDHSELPRLTWWLTLAGGAGAAVLLTAGRALWIAPLFASVLCVDAVAQRIHPYPFFDNAVLAEPPQAAAIHAQPDWREYRHAHVTWAEVYGFTQPTDPALLPAFERVTHGLVASLNVLWDVPSMNGSLALMQGRRRIIDAMLRDEWMGQDPTPAGLRLSDILSVRFLTFDDVVPDPSYRLLERDAARGLVLMENTAARPRFQFYDQQVEAASPEAALQILSDLQEPLLVLETPAGAAPHGYAAPGAARQARYELLEDRPDRYRLRIDTEAPVWLFLADTNYPGWRATIDGASTPIYSAQILGKAVLAPAGSHELVLEFRSDSIAWGARITAATLVLALLTLVGLRLRRRTSSSHALNS